MKKDNVVQTKSFDFALKIIEIYKYLKEEKREFVMSKQLLRSGTSVGANIEEAIGAQTDKDFFYENNYFIQRNA
jgi:four helix bundle protein